MSEKLSMGTRLGYGVADFGQNIIFQATGIYLLYFYTDIFGIEAGFVGGLFLIARIWDGINDPIMGYLAQKTRTRWGTYRPYLLFAAFPMAISMILLFYAPELSTSGKLVYAAITYIFFGMAFTAYNVPYGTLTAVMTDDYHERSRLTGFRMTFAMLGGILAGVGMLPLVERLGGGEQGFLLAAVIFSAIIFITNLSGFFSVKERIIPQKSASTALGESFKNLQKNRPFWLLCIAFGCCFAALGVYSATIAYYFEYYMGNKEGTSGALLIMMGTTAVTIPFWAWLAQKIGKRTVFLIGAGFYLIAFMGLFFIQPENTVMIYFWLFAQGIGNGAAAFTSWAMLPDTVEYGEWKTGQRTAGLSYGIFGFCFKLGLGIGGATTGFVLSVAGYLPGEVQSPEVLLAIRTLLTLVPMGLIIISFVSIWQYRITASLHQKILTDLQHTTIEISQ